VYRFWILALLVVSAGQLRAQTTEQEVIEAARQSCAEMDSGEFSAPDDAVKRVDLDGDGTKDVLVDEGKFACSTSATLGRRATACDRRRRSRRLDGSGLAPGGLG
jgi:hypothetical protein